MLVPATHSSPARAGRLGGVVMRRGATMLRRLAVLVAFVFVCGCNNATDRPEQPTADDKPKDAKVKPMGGPFMDDATLEFRGPSFTDADL
jgi:hypothetical protein